MSMKRSIGPAQLVRFLTEGYDFIGNRCDALGTDVFEVRVGPAAVTFMRGPAAAELFYSSDSFVRSGAMPRRIRRTLLGEDGVQTLDDEQHRARKALFTSVLDAGAVRDLTSRVDDLWDAATRRWEDDGGPVVLYDKVARMLCRAVCDWAGVEVEERKVAHRTAQLLSLIESPGQVGPGHWKGRRSRSDLEGWIEGLVEEERHRPDPPAGSTLTPFQAISRHRDSNGELPDARTAAVEVLNVLRPVVAVSRFAVFAAAALASHPEWRERLRDGDDEGLGWFVQEVRRYYPFFPATGARVREPFEWGGVRFPAGRLVVFDLYGTDHHPDVWADPERFDPERFRDRRPTPFDLVPQGAGEAGSGHRCPGEPPTITLMAGAVRWLTRAISYTVPAQDLRISRRQIPAIPRSGMVIADVRRPDGRPGSPAVASAALDEAACPHSRPQPDTAATRKQRAAARQEQAEQLPFPAVGARPGG